MAQVVVAYRMEEVPHSILLRGGRGEGKDDSSLPPLVLAVRKGKEGELSLSSLLEAGDQEKCSH